MLWLAYLGCFVGGAFVANGVPHFVQGMCGNKFQSPFASPPGIGETSALVNVIWGWFNFLVGGVLLYFSSPLVGTEGMAIVAMLGALVSALWLSHHFGRVRSSAPHP